MSARHSRWFSAAAVTAVGLITTLALGLFPTPTAATASETAATAHLHLRLVRAVPAIDSTYRGSPATISWWFSEPVRLKATSFKVKDSLGAVVALGRLSRDTAKAVRVFAAVPKTMAPGRYTVTWRAMGRDSHVVKGEYTFTLAR